MKTKNKRIALVEIAVVLCSVFLVATLPAIAAEQNQEMQKISANTITTPSEDDYVLGIYGNANEDDTIDMRDLTYVKLIFFGKKPETELADAKYDGKINPLDFIQIKLIIVGKEKELTFLDSSYLEQPGKVVTVKKPINGIVVTWRGMLEMLRILKVPTDKIVGVESLIQSSGGGQWGLNYKVFFPEYQDKTSIGLVWTPDCEAILNLHPDVVFLHPNQRLDKASDVLNSAGITVIRINGGAGGRRIPEEVKKLGYLFGNQNAAREFLDFYQGITNTINERVEDILEKDRPTVYFESPFGAYQTSGEGETYVAATGGKDIFGVLGGDELSVDPEAVAVRNPDIIVKGTHGGGYHLDAEDMEELKKAREEIMSRLELQNVKAVKEGKVYVISGYILNYGPYAGNRGFLHKLYMAKWLHPELLEDLDPKAIHQEYLTKFQGLDYDLDEHGVFVYPEQG
jgi:iron complex transport system substrate-binding protein